MAPGEVVGDGMEHLDLLWTGFKMVDAAVQRAAGFDQRSGFVDVERQRDFVRLENLSILKPFLIAGFIAYILNFLMEIFENLLFKLKYFQNDKKKKIARLISIFVTYSIFIMLIVILVNNIIPHIYYSIYDIIVNLPYYTEKITEFLTNLFNKFELRPDLEVELMKRLDLQFQYITNNLSNILPYLGKFASTFMDILMNSILGIIISIYMLYDKERFILMLKKMLYAIFPESFANYSYRAGKILNKSMRSYIGAKSISALIIGIAFYLVLLVLGIKYSVLIAILLGITNLIPWFGCWIGLIPVFPIILLQSSSKALWFFLIFNIITQIDGNYLSPKLQGNKLGISPFWIMFAIIVFGSLFGIIGFFIGVPVFYVIYVLFGEFINKRIKKKNIICDDDNCFYKKDIEI